jgi:transposase-like protein
MTKRTPPYSPEVRERAVRMVFEHRNEYTSQYEAILSIAAKIGCSRETLRHWVRQAERDQGLRSGPTSADQERIKSLAPSTYYEHAARKANPDRRPARERRDAELCQEIRRVFAANFGVYGVRKVWRQMQRKGIDVARCTVARLMRQMGLQGAVHGKSIRTTVSDAAAPRPRDRVNRQFKAPRPNALWVSDFTYVGPGRDRTAEASSAGCRGSARAASAATPRAWRQCWSGYRPRRRSPSELAGPADCQVRSRAHSGPPGRRMRAWRE